VPVAEEDVVQEVGVASTGQGVEAVGAVAAPPVRRRDCAHACRIVPGAGGAAEEAGEA